jgi:hypothetical protein
MTVIEFWSIHPGGVDFVIHLTKIFGLLLAICQSVYSKEVQRVQASERIGVPPEQPAGEEDVISCLCEPLTQVYQSEYVQPVQVSPLLQV